MSIGDSFNQSVAYYDSWMRKAMPDFEGLYTAALELIPFAKGSEIDVLDLGAGTGIFSEQIHKHYPEASFTLVDLAEKMLNKARLRFEGKTGKFDYQVDDYRKLDCFGSYQLIISSLSIHHLEDQEKSSLFKQVYNHLASGGVFINIDQIKAPTEKMDQFYWSQWLELVRKRGASEEEIEESVKRRKTYDKESLLSEQLSWLNDAGFADVDCVYKTYFVGVFYAAKP